MLLKLMNGLYGISLAENASNTQKFLSKVIRFLKYYTPEEFKPVRLKEELDTLGLVMELISFSSGNQYSLSLNISDRDLLNLYIPSGSLLLLMMEILESTKDAAAEAGGVLMKLYQEQEAVVIAIGDINSPDPEKIGLMADRFKKSFDLLADTSVFIESNCNSSGAAKIIIRPKL